MNKIEEVDRFSCLLTLIVFIFGILVSAIFASGDVNGRVNLLAYIILFVLWPFLSLILLVSFHLFKINSKYSVLKWIDSPVLPKNWNSSVNRLKGLQLFPPWLAMMSHRLTLAFSLGCLVSFFFVLLFTDVAFVWRSTLLDVNFLFPIIEKLALPWSFFDNAQPTKEFLIQTQEIRIAQVTNDQVDYGQWWRYLIMAQICYAITPRLLVWLWERNKFKTHLKRSLPTDICVKPLLNQQPSQTALKDVCNTRPTLHDFNLVCWLPIEQNMLIQVLAQFSTPSNQYHMRCSHGKENELLAISDKKAMLVLVAAWEPPMGELMDFFEQGHGVILPLDFDGDKWQPINSKYLDEWRRFCFPLSAWEIYIDKELM